MESGESTDQSDYQGNLNLQLSLGLPSQSPPPSPPPPDPSPLSLHSWSQSPPPPPPPECPPSLHISSQSPLPPPPPECLQPQTQPASPQTQNQPSEIINEPRPRRRRTRADTRRIEPPYPWSTDRRAVVHELEYLKSNHILTIKGEVKCRKCEKKYEMEYDLMTKLDVITRFIKNEKDSMHDRAPSCWINPILPNCKLCNKEKCVEPVISHEEKEEEDDKFSKINWLFLLLGQLLGCLKLKQLKYFCAQTNIHRTGAKNRLLYVTYLALCKQLQPSNRLFE